MKHTHTKLVHEKYRMARLFGTLFNCDKMSRKISLTFPMIIVAVTLSGQSC